MKTLHFFSLMVACIFPTAIAEGGIVQPFESSAAFHPVNPIDEIILQGLTNRGIEPAHLCSDAVFIRRVFLDVIGTLPAQREIQLFLSDHRPDKRSLLIDHLLGREEYAEYGLMKWCDLLRVKAEYPINLWPNAVQAYSRWIHDSLAENKPYDRFVRELLTSSGSNFRVPPVNFYRAVQGQEPSAIAGAVALTWMGVRVDQWPSEKRENLEAFFSHIAFKKTAEWKEEIVYLDPAFTKPLDAVFPDGTKVRIQPDQDPRAIFAEWLIQPDNPWFARNIVNRIWYWLMGRGIIHEPDDIRPDNPPVYPPLLTYLEKELVKAHYDLKQIYRLILNSRIYQQSSIPQSDHPDAEKMFAQYPVRQLDAEVLNDALNSIFGGRDNYSSNIPEPYTFIPPQHRSITLADGSITSPFLELFGRPSRDTGLESERNNQPTEAQRLHFLNSTQVQSKIEKSWRLQRLLKTTQKDRRNLIRVLYMNVLSRPPLPSEMKVGMHYFQDKKINPKQAASDLAWALINTKEFLYRH